MRQKLKSQNVHVNETNLHSLPEVWGYDLLDIEHSKVFSLHCRRILGGRNFVRVRNVVVAAIFDFMTVEDWGE